MLTEDPLVIVEHSKNVSPAMLLLGLTLLGLVNDDVASIAAGLLVGAGYLGFGSALVVCFAVILAGDIAWFLIGRGPAQTALSVAPVRWLVKPEDIEVAKEWFSRYGMALIVLGRFLPGTRTPIFLAAGVLETTRFSRVAAYMAGASAAWALTIVSFTAALGVRINSLVLEHASMAASLGLATLVAAWLVLKALGKTGSRVISRHRATPPGSGLLRHGPARDTRSSDEPGEGLPEKVAR